MPNITRDIYPQNLVDSKSYLADPRYGVIFAKYLNRGDKENWMPALVDLVENISLVVNYFS